MLRSTHTPTWVLNKYHLRNQQSKNSIWTSRRIRTWENQIFLQKMLLKNSQFKVLLHLSRLSSGIHPKENLLSSYCVLCMKIQRKETVFALQKVTVQHSGFQNVICVLHTFFKCKLNESSISKPLLRRDALRWQTRLGPKFLLICPTGSSQSPQLPPNNSNCTEWHSIVPSNLVNQCQSPQTAD